MNKLVKISIVVILIIQNSCATIFSVRELNSPFFAMYKCTENLYIDEIEISVGSWMSYYSWILENKGKMEADKILPDSNGVSQFVWKYINTKSDKESRIGSAQTKQKFGFFLDKCPDFVYQDSVDHRILRGIKINWCPYRHRPITGLTFEQVINTLCRFFQSA